MAKTTLTAFAALLVTLNNAQAAHGGYERWIDAPSVRLDIAMYLLVLPPAKGRTPQDNWRYYSVVVDPDTSETLVDVPWEAGDGPEVGLTKNLYWARPMTFDPTFQDSAAMLGWYHYAMINLPFLTQIDGVSIEPADNIEHPLDGRALTGFRMTFDPGPGKIHAGDVEFYIDPQTNLMAAWRFHTRFPMLPGDILPDEAPGVPGSPLRVVETHADYDGFIIPRAYAAFDKGGNAIGTHVVLDADFEAAFPKDALTPPEDAITVFER